MKSCKTCQNDTIKDHDFFKQVLILRFKFQRPIMILAIAVVLIILVDILVEDIAFSLGLKITIALFSFTAFQMIENKLNLFNDFLFNLNNGRFNCCPACNLIIDENGTAFETTPKGLNKYYRNNVLRSA